MAYTIIAPDKRVTVDGVSRRVKGLALRADIHAVNWFGERGEIEFAIDENGRKRNNEEFTVEARFQEALDLHAAVLAEEAAGTPPAPPES